MGLFDIFKKKEPMTAEQLKWEYLWEKWRLEEVPEPYNTIMTYYKEIKKEGHTRFFLNIAFCGEVEKAVEKNGRGVKDVKYYFVNRFRWSNPYVYWGYGIIL